MSKAFSLSRRFLSSPRRSAPFRGDERERESPFAEWRPIHAEGTKNTRTRAICIVYSRVEKTRRLSRALRGTFERYRSTSRRRANRFLERDVRQRRGGVGMTLSRASRATPVATLDSRRATRRRSQHPREIALLIERSRN